jgi:hypothetical protein
VGSTASTASRCLATAVPPVSGMSVRLATRISRAPWCREMGGVALLPGCFDGVRVIMLPDEGNGLFPWQPVNDGEAGQCRPDPSPAAGTDNLHAFSQGTFPGFVQDVPCVRLVAGQPEAGPANPAGLPGNGRWWLAAQVDGEGGLRPGRERPPQAAAPDEPAGWPPQHASAGSFPRACHHPP